MVIDIPIVSVVRSPNRATSFGAVAEPANTSSVIGRKEMPASRAPSPFTSCR